MKIIDVSHADLVLPGDCLGGAVLDLGIQVGTPGLRNYHVVVRQTRKTVDIARRDGMQYGEPRRHLVINCCHGATRDRLRRVLAAGERCRRIYASDGAHLQTCPDCSGTRYTRPPHDLGPFIDAEIAGRITPLAAAGLMWASVLRVEAGLGPVTYVNGAEGRRRCSPTMSDVSALLDNGHILLPLPDRIARLRLED